MNPTHLQIVAAILFAVAVLHTFAAKFFETLGALHPRHAGLFHLLGEVEVVFGFWAMVLIVAMAMMVGPGAAVEYAESRQYVEPLFVFVIMVVAASKPVLDLVRDAVAAVAKRLPMRTELSELWLGLAAVPVLGSLITEPAAMTLAALILAPIVFRPDVPERLKYGALGVLFVNVSIGGTLTSYAAPPVLMVAGTWNWDSSFMLANFGWKALIAVIVNATALCLLARRHLDAPAREALPVRAPRIVSLIHVAFLVGVVLSAHHIVIFMGLFLFFLGYTRAYQKHQAPLIVREGLLVGFFLAGLVVLGGMQQWWLQPVVSGLQPQALFFGALGLTAITDNAALTYLGSLTAGISPQSQYMLVAGAVAGGGLTVIANAPNPAGIALLRGGFKHESVGAGGLLLGALAPTVVAAAAFLLL